MYWKFEYSLCVYAVWIICILTVQYHSLIYSLTLFHTGWLLSGVYIGTRLRLWLSLLFKKWNSVSVPKGKYTDTPQCK